MLTEGLGRDVPASGRRDPEAFRRIVRVHANTEAPCYRHLTII